MITTMVIIYSKLDVSGDNVSGDNVSGDDASVDEVSHDDLNLMVMMFLVMMFPRKLGDWSSHGRVKHETGRREGGPPFHNAPIFLT